MSDICWHKDMENCPNGVPVLIRYDDGTVELIQAEENDTDWSFNYPLRGLKIPNVAYHDAWACVDTEPTP